MTAVPPPISLSPPDPGVREVYEAAKAEEVVQQWKDELLAHRKKVEEANGGNCTGVTLCDTISLSDKSWTADAANIVATFLKEPFDGTGVPLARGIIVADLSDTIASRMTEEGIQVLQTLSDAFTDSNLVDVNLSDNAVGEQAIMACKTVLTKKSLERLALCNNGLAFESMARVADFLTNDEDGTGCIASRLTKLHFHSNMSGDPG